MSRGPKVGGTLWPVLRHKESRRDGGVKVEWVGDGHEMSTKMRVRRPPVDCRGSPTQHYPPVLRWKRTNVFNKRLPSPPILIYFLGHLSPLRSDTLVVFTEVMILRSRPLPETFSRCTQFTLRVPLVGVDLWGSWWVSEMGVEGS